jgi:3-oxoacyl-[acyl-carrier-protein] synthase-3
MIAMTDEALGVTLSGDDLVGSRRTSLDLWTRQERAGSEGRRRHLDQGIAAAVPRRASRTQDYEVLTENERERCALPPPASANDASSNRAMHERSMRTCRGQAAGLAGLGTRFRRLAHPRHADPRLSDSRHRDPVAASSRPAHFDPCIRRESRMFVPVCTADRVVHPANRRPETGIDSCRGRIQPYLPIRGPVTWPLFGDAGSATAIEVDESADPMHFDLHSDGSGGT